MLARNGTINRNNQNKKLIEDLNSNNRLYEILIDKKIFDKINIHWYQIYE